MISRWLTIAICFSLSFHDSSLANDTAKKASFSKQIVPILSQHCLKCHSKEKRIRAGLDLSSEKRALIGAESGPVIVPGKPTQSLLIQVLGKNADPHMPPRGQLSVDETTTIASWIQSLPSDTQVGMQLNDSSKHWAFQPIQSQSLPKLKNALWIKSPIDAFIHDQLSKAGLEPSPESKKEILLRRLYFDLIGLPPTPEQINAFLNDHSPDAYERIVDQLLASPAYGERWGRHWLDLARYADSSGFHQDFDRPNAWRYRDYVIKSFNRDKSYATFIKEQLAGDLLPNATVESWIATGFNRNGPSNEDNMGKGLAKVKYRYDQLDDVVSTTSNVFLGLTIGCARCHDHKYDPLTQKDYYQFLAYFNSTEPLRLEIPSFRSDKPTLHPHKSKKDKWTPITARVRSDRGTKERATHILWRGNVSNQGPKVKADIPAILQKSSKVSSRLSLARWIANKDNPLTWRVLANRIWAHHFGRGLVATPSNFGKLGEKPTHPQLLDWLAMYLRDHDGRLKPLHRMIVTSATYRQSSSVNSLSNTGAQIDPENRLLWRMNKRRLEAEPLRDGMLSCSNMLNRHMGGPGIKPRIRPELLIASQRNKWPTVTKEGPQHWRRSVYIYVKRQLQFPMMELFDAPTTTHSCAERTKSLVPTQPLVLMNDEFVLEQSRYFAERVIHEVGQDRKSQIERALFIALGKKPDTQRVSEGESFVDQQTKLLLHDGHSKAQAQRQALADFCQVLMNLSEFVYVD